METNELQDMREQMALLKETLKNEQIINDRLIRESMRQKVSSIHRRAWIVGICALYVCTFGIWSFHNMGFTWWFNGATVLLMIYSMFETIRIHRRFDKGMVMTDDLRTAAHAARQLKQDYIRSLHIGLALVFLWIIWLGVEVIFGHTIYADSSLGVRIALLASMLVGGVIGGIIGYAIHKKVLRLCDDIIRQVEE